MWWRGRTPPKKNIIFCPQNDKFWCLLTQFLTASKHGQSLYRNLAARTYTVESRNDAYKNSAKIIHIHG